MIEVLPDPLGPTIETTSEVSIAKLIPLKTRFQGREAAGHQDLVRRRVVENINGNEVRSERFVNNFSTNIFIFFISKIEQIY